MKILCSAALLCAILPSPAAAPGKLRVVAGPGGVIQSVRAFLRAVDEGDGRSLAAALCNDRHAVQVELDEGQERLVSVETDPAAFFEVGADGRPISATRAADFKEQLTGAVRGKRTQDLVTRIQSMRANCYSEQCSQATVQFVRSFTFRDGTKAVVPMRATALLRYQGKAEPRFRIYHWHASPAEKNAAVEAESKQPDHRRRDEPRDSAPPSSRSKDSRASAR